MHPEATVASVLELHQAGLNNCEISRRTGISRPTTRDWSKAVVPIRPAMPFTRRLLGSGSCQRCGGRTMSSTASAPAYVHLLGLYLGDGAISEHRRQVYRLRITLDVRYPGIVQECETAMGAVVPQNRASRQLRRVQLLRGPCLLKGWPCLFPQHVSGKSIRDRYFLPTGSKDSRNDGQSNCSRG